MQPVKVIVTTDPGQDEAAAIMMMLAAPESFEILGLVATAGNIGLDHAVINSLKILELAGRADIPVFAGCPRPILRKLVTADHVHGPTGSRWARAAPAHGQAAEATWSGLHSGDAALRAAGRSAYRFPVPDDQSRPGPGRKRPTSRRGSAASS